MEGQLPPEWGDLRAAGYLGLQGNRLRGPLPPAWGNLTQLALLDLGSNSLRGEFPPAWGGMASLQVRRAGRGAARRGALATSGWPRSAEIRRTLVLCLGWPALQMYCELRPPQALNLEGNGFTGPLPPEWSKMTALQRLSVRNMCAVCGPPPFAQGEHCGTAWRALQPTLLAACAWLATAEQVSACPSHSSSPLAAEVDIWLQGSSLNWPCGSGNCYKVPLGFVGQAVIIAAIVAVLATLCVCRRCYVSRRGGNFLWGGRDAQRQASSEAGGWVAWPADAAHGTPAAWVAAEPVQPQHAARVALTTPPAVACCPAPQALDGRGARRAAAAAGAGCDA